MSTTLMPSTQVIITFSVQISTDREAELLTLLFFLLTPILFMWQVRQKVYRFRNELVLIAADINGLLTFIGKVIAITFISFAYGLGILR